VAPEIFDTSATLETTQAAWTERHAKHPRKKWMLMIPAAGLEQTNCTKL